jgi:uncharacterized protein (TIGR01777 family)
MRVVVTGATGFIGVPLVAALRARGDAVVALVRDEQRARARLGDGVELVATDLETAGPWQRAIAGSDAVVSLAGEPLGGKRWDARQKQVIRDSRVEATRVVVEAIAAADAAARPKVLVSVSGVDYYPPAGPPMDDDEVTEADPPGDSFLARVCRDWEREATAAEPLGVRVVRLRLGLVIGAGGGALSRMLPAFRRFVGGKLGDGEQWASWIHRDDVVAIIAAALADARYAGPINGVAPEAVRNAQLAKAIGLATHRPSWLRVPGFAIRAALGEFAEAILTGRRVVPRKLAELDYAWKHPTLAEALVDSV